MKAVIIMATPCPKSLHGTMVCIEKTAMHGKGEK